MPEWTDRFRRQLCWFVNDDRGQDLMEYALLTGAIGLAGFAAWGTITTGIDTAYTGWDTGVQAIWEPDDPVVSP